MIGTNATPRRMWSEAELQALPDDGHLHEVVDGRLVMSPKNDFFHGRIAVRIACAFEIFNRRKRLGVVLDSSTGFWMKNHNCRAPDVSFVPHERLRRMGFQPSTRAFFPGAPDLAVEILSPNNTRIEIDARLRDFFASGTRLAWIVDPDRRTVEVHLSLRRHECLGPDEILVGEPVLPGFRQTVGALFED